MSRFLNVCLLGLVVACGADKVVDDPDDPDANPTNARVKLTVQGPSRVTVPGGRSVPLRFAATQVSGGAPVANLDVRFALQGNPGVGTTLSAQTSRTDEDGLVEVTFVSGTQANATARVVASAENASNATIEVVIDVGLSVVTGGYEFSMSVTPLDFMDKTKESYVVVSNLVNFLVNPVEAILVKWLVYEDGTAKRDTKRAVCHGQTDLWAQLGCTAAIATAPELIKAALGFDTSGTASTLYQALTDAGKLVQKMEVGGVLDVKSYDSNTKQFTATLNFDTYRLLWKARKDCQRGGENANDSCCGHTLFDAKKFGGLPFIKACGAGSTDATCLDVRGTIQPSSARGRYTLTMDEASLAVAYGQLLRGVMEHAVLPTVLDPSQYHKEADGSITTDNFADNLSSCIDTDSVAKTVFCTLGIEALKTLMRSGFAVLDAVGLQNTVGKLSITTGQLIDQNNDGKPDSMTATVNMISPNAATANQTIPVSGVYADRLCVADRECGDGQVCKFMRHSIDGCFARNQCGPKQGTKAAAEQCSSANQCASGTCMLPVASTFEAEYTNQCFQSCAFDSDCPSGMHCDLDGYVSVQSGGALKTATCVR